MFAAPCDQLLEFRKNVNPQKRFSDYCVVGLKAVF